MARTQVFISHPSEDAELAGAVAELLARGCGLGADQVFCSSKVGMRIPAGRAFKEYMRHRLDGTTLLVQLVTPAYLDSVFCMFEVGAAWVNYIATFPLVVPDVTYGQLDAITGGVEARPIGDRHALNELFQAVIRDSGATDMEVWGKERTRFVRRLPKLLDSISGRRNVTKAEFAAVSSDLERARQLARYADVIVPVDELFENVRDAYYFLNNQVVGGDFHDEYILRILRDSVVKAAAAFERVTGGPCRAVIKWLEEPPTSPTILEEWPVRDLVRSDRRPVSVTGSDYVGNNTDFRSIVEQGQPFYVSNNLPSMYLAGEYENSHWSEEAVRADRIAYRSAIVVPIGRLRENGQLAAALGTDALNDLVGFLCVDATSTDAFDVDRDVRLAQSLANGLYPPLYLYRQVTSSEADYTPG